MDLAALMFLSPRLPKKEFEDLRKEALTQFKETSHRLNTHIREAVNAAYYPEYHPYRRSLSKEEADLASMTPEAVKEFLRFLSQENALVLVYGPREKEAEIVANVEKMLLKFPAKGQSVLSSCEPALAPSEDITLCADVPQTFFCGRQPGFDYSDPHYFAKLLALAIVASAQNSILFREIREKLGLAYYCAGENVIRAHDSYIEISVVTKNETARLVRDKIREILEKVVQEGVSQEDFETVKQEVLGSLVVALDSSGDLLGLCTRERVRGRKIPEIKNWLKALKNVTRDEVNSACKELFAAKQLKFVSMGGNK
ncbi:hypothetical protein AGMMS50296_2440 [Alphaproteobacteria bacterium]|nr:hypothetical protein AGMMS50296_2440 [Alphaproteobacteria bacterium]